MFCDYNSHRNKLGRTWFDIVIKCSHFTTSIWYTSFISLYSPHRGQYINKHEILINANWIQSRLQYMQLGIITVSMFVLIFSKIGMQITTMLFLLNCRFYGLLHDCLHRWSFDFGRIIIFLKLNFQTSACVQIFSSVFTFLMFVSCN